MNLLINYLIYIVNDSAHSCSRIVRYTDSNLQSRYIMFYESCNYFAELFCIKELSRFVQYLIVPKDKVYYKSKFLITTKINSQDFY